MLRRGSVLSARYNTEESFRANEEGISLPSKSIAVCSIPDSGPKNGPALLAGPRWVGHAAQVADWAASPLRTSTKRVCGIGSIGGTTKSPGQGAGDAGALLQLLSRSSLGVVVLGRQRYAPTTEKRVRCSDWRCGASERRGRSRSHDYALGTGRARGGGNGRPVSPQRVTRPLVPVM
jgi:hypothetical protein